MSPLQGEKVLSGLDPGALPLAITSHAVGVKNGLARPLPQAVLTTSLPSAVCLLPTSYFLLAFSVPARGTQGGPYQPSIVLITVTAFFS